MARGRYRLRMELWRNIHPGPGEWADRLVKWVEYWDGLGAGRWEVGEERELAATWATAAEVIDAARGIVAATHARGMSGRLAGLVVVDGRRDVQVWHWSVARDEPVCHPA